MDELRYWREHSISSYWNGTMNEVKQKHKTSRFWKQHHQYQWHKTLFIAITDHYMTSFKIRTRARTSLYATLMLVYMLFIQLTTWRVAIYGKMSTIHEVCMKSLSCEAYINNVIVSMYMPHTNINAETQFFDSINTSVQPSGTFILLYNNHSLHSLHNVKHFTC